jgi:hypothetical protein
MLGLILAFGPKGWVAHLGGDWRDGIGPQADEGHDVLQRRVPP